MKTMHFYIFMQKTGKENMNSDNVHSILAEKGRKMKKRMSILNYKRRYKISFFLKLIH